MMNILLQITTQVPPEATEPLSFLQLIMKGGVIMIPIILLSLIAVYITIERYLYIRNVTKEKKGFITDIKKHLQDGDVKSAKLYAERESTATGNIILCGLDSLGRPIREIDAMMESATNIEVALMEKNTGYLGIIAGVAPMLGFIGTILGIIKIFYDISLTDNISIGIIAGGLYEKMITSGSGLAVGVIAYTAYHLLQQRINSFTLHIQKDALEFIRSIGSASK